MHRIWKRTISILLAVLLLVGAAPAAGLAGIADVLSLTASAANYSGTCGANVTWALDTVTGTLTISGTGAMKDIPSSSSAPWYSYSSYVKTVIIENGVTSIGDRAFEDCTRLTSVTIPDSVTSIGDAAFWNCTSLTSVTIPDSVTRIGEAAFYDCWSLTSVTIPDSVTSIGNWTFEICTSLTSVTIGGSVTSIGNGAFYRCSSLSDVYYAGTQAEWDSIAIEKYNDAILNAALHFQQEVNPGDVDGDGTITLKDAALISRYLVGGWNVTVDADAADVDNDGSVTLRDAALIQRFIVGGWGVVLR